MLLCISPIPFIYLYYFSNDTSQYNGVCGGGTGPFSGVVNSREAVSHLDLLVGNKKLTCKGHNNVKSKMQNTEEVGQKINFYRDNCTIVLFLSCFKSLL